jgi:hypothetical protein
LTGRVLTPDGSQKIDADQAAPLSEAVALGRCVAEALLCQGAAAMIRQSRGKG